MEDEKSQYTFRQWNPARVDESWGEDNGSPTEISCPAYCICCNVVEKFFKSEYQEVMNYCRHGSKTSDAAFAELEKENSGNTTMWRFICWVMSVIGHVLLFSPIITLFSWIPLVGHLLATILTFAAFIFALLWATILQFFIMAASWLFYRPVYGICLLTLVGLGIALMVYGGK